MTFPSRDTAVRAALLFTLSGLAGCGSAADAAADADGSRSGAQADPAAMAAGSDVQTMMDQLLLQSATAREKLEGLVRITRG